MKTITSRDNPAFKNLRALATEARERKRQGRAVLDGIHLVQVWTERKGQPESVVVSDSGLARPEVAGWLEANPGLAVIHLPDTLFAVLSAVDTPTGILAVVPIPLKPIQPVIGSCVVLDAIQDAGNLGSILRSAAAAGIAHALLTPGCAQAWSPKVLRAAMGAHCHLTVEEGVNVLSRLTDYPGLKVATRLDPAASPLHQLDLRGPVAWFFGNEGAGLSPALSAFANTSTLIPMPGGMESLNVGAAAAVCLFEEVRQKALVA